MLQHYFFLEETRGDAIPMLPTARGATEACEAVAVTDWIKFWCGFLLSVDDLTLLSFLGFAVRFFLRLARRAMVELLVAVISVSTLAKIPENSPLFNNFFLIAYFLKYSWRFLKSKWNQHNINTLQLTDIKCQQIIFQLTASCCIPAPNFVELWNHTTKTLYQAKEKNM